MGTARENEFACEEEKVVTTACGCHCGAGACVVKVHVRHGVITRIETDDDDDELQLRACWRGRAYRQRVYSPDRLKFPLRRVGARGEGKFERITWDEALDTVARELKRVKETYGPAAIIMRREKGGGDTGRLHQAGVIDRLLCMMGGCTEIWGNMSLHGGLFAAAATYGTVTTRCSRDDLLNSRLIIMWGWNPADTITGANTPYLLAQAKEKGSKIICIDPRYTDSAAVFASQWIPIIPGTDAALLIAMAYVITKRNLQDQAFLDKYTVGFDRFKDYVLGQEDGTPKTPFWGESITGVPAASIEKLAIDYATSKPAALMCGISPGRTAYGEQYHRAAITMSAMTGNIGIHGGSSAGNVWQTAIGGLPYIKLPHMGGNVANPLEQGAPRRKDALPGLGEHASSARIHFTRLADAILKGRSGGYPSDYKLLYVVGTSFPNQYPNINKSVEALKKLEFIVVHEQFMTPTAKFADVVLPASSIYERNDVSAGHGTPAFYGYMHKVVEPPGEAKSHLEIATELAARLGISRFGDKTEEAWLREIVAGSDIPDYDAFKKRGFHKIKLAEPYVAFKTQIEDPGKHPFPTPSGKIEIYSQQLADIGHPAIPPIPKYIETWENRNDALSKKYPLQLITTHFWRRAHTQYDNVPWLRELEAQAVKINSKDAKARGINNGDLVRVFNDRGQMIIPATVTQRIMPGVVDVPEGAWFDPDERGIDRGGSPNVLTRDEPSPGGALASNTALVQVEKADGS